MSSVFIPNTTVTFLETATTTDARGDTVESDTAVSTGVPAFWAQKDQRTWDPVTQRRTVIRGFRVRLRPGTAVTEHQRLRNERTEEIGYVRDIDRQAVTGTAGDVIVRLESIQQ